METAAIHRKFNSVLSGYIRKRVNNKEDVKDLLQEVYIKIHGNLPRLKETENLKSWLFTITRNTIIDYYRKNGQKNSFSLVEKAGIEDQIDESFDQAKDLERCIRHFIKGLPGDYKDIIVDSEIRGIKQKDLAGKYNLAYPSVRSRVQRGRLKLKEMFVDCCKIQVDSRGNILEAIPRSGKCS